MLAYFLPGVTLNKGTSTGCSYHEHLDSEIPVDPYLLSQAELDLNKNNRIFFYTGQFLVKTAGGRVGGSCPWAKSLCLYGKPPPPRIFTAYINIL